MFKIITILSLFVASAFAGNVPRWEGRVVGGQTAFNDQFPWIVSIRTDENFHFCGGTILSARFIVSAAHCFQDGAGVDEVFVYVGAHHIENDGEQVALDRIIPHPDYNKLGTRELDVAVLRTARNIPDFARRQIALTNTEVREGEVVTVAGWGHVWARPGEETLDPEFLQFLHKRTISQAECVRRMGRPIPASAICTTSPMDQGACMGDSGGPLTNALNQLVGIVSWGIPCARGFPDMYGNVFLLRGWINARIAENAP